MQQSAPHQHAAQKLVRQSGDIAAPLSGASQLSVLTFNILADGLAQDGGFIRVGGCSWTRAENVSISMQRSKHVRQQGYRACGRNISIVCMGSAIHVQAPEEALQWDHRKTLLLAEIAAADADIVCLQECNHFGEPRVASCYSISWQTVAVCTGAIVGGAHQLHWKIHPSHLTTLQ